MMTKAVFNVKTVLLAFPKSGNAMVMWIAEVLLYQMNSTVVIGSHSTLCDHNELHWLML
jgi:hypothetical protein